MNSSERDAVQDWTDRACVESSRNGCPEHFRLLVQRYQKPVFAFLASRMDNPLEAKEAAQESFVRAFLSLKTLRKPESFYSWLLGIAGRVAKEQFRSAAHRERDRQAAEVMLAEAEDGGKVYPLEEAIAALPETYRQVILLRYYEGLSCQEAAACLSTPLGTVTKTLSCKECLGGLKIISVGQSFAADKYPGGLAPRGYPGRYVPYEIQLAPQEFNVRVANANAAKRCVLTGVYDRKLQLQQELETHCPLFHLCPSVVALCRSG